MTAPLDSDILSENCSTSTRFRQFVWEIQHLQTICPDTASPILNLANSNEGNEATAWDCGQLSKTGQETAAWVCGQVKSAGQFVKKTSAPIRHYTTPLDMLQDCTDQLQGCTDLTQDCMDLMQDFTDLMWDCKDLMQDYFVVWTWHKVAQTPGQH